MEPGDRAFNLRSPISNLRYPNRICVASARLRYNSVIGIQQPTIHGHPTWQKQIDPIQPTLTFIDADIISGKDEIAREELISRVSQYRTAGVAPLWVNWMRHRADMRFVCLGA